MELIRQVDKASVASGGQLLAEGNLVAFPTETVYGLGANAEDGRAVAKIFAAKSSYQGNFQNWILLSRKKVIKDFPISRIYTNNNLF